MRILGIETSCDETALALVEANGELVEPRFKVLKSLIASQIKIHRPFGGVVPNLAKREHLKNLPILYNQLLATSYQLPDLIAVTVGPGLEPALWTGIEFANALYQKLKLQNPNVKLVGANHLEGHLYSFLLPKKTVRSNVKILRQRRIRLRRKMSKVFPAVALLVSGGHTILLLLKSLTNRKKLGETRDDAVGEAFDKVARMLGLPYPGGPEIEKLAQGGDPRAINFPRPMLAPSRSSTGMHYNYDFSFSGLKTSVLYYLRDNPNSTNFKTNATKKISRHSHTFVDSHYVADVAASFQQAAIDVLVNKTMRAAKEYRAKSILLSGGVAANKALRATLKRGAKNLNTRFLVPDLQFNTDNAAMIAVAGYIGLLRKKTYKLVAKGDMNI